MRAEHVQGCETIEERLKEFVTHYKSSLADDQKVKLIDKQDLSSQG